jgi:D-alanyl-D-alanine carboxypeptidase (penicillin-binding protein 5/6)
VRAVVLCVVVLGGLGLGPLASDRAGAASTTTATSTTSTTLPGTPPPASAWVVVDVATGRVLAAHNDQAPLRPASLTKVLTALVATGWLPTNARVPVTADATTVYPDRVGMKLGQVWPLDMVMHSLLIFSANDAAYAIADRVAGSLHRFAAVMATAAAQLGMVDHPVLHDPAGLDGSEGVDGGNLISARDLAIAGRALLAQRYLANIVKLHDYSFTDPGGVAHDILSKNAAFLAAEPGAIGVKTGFTDRAGSCLMGAATQKGRTMLVVVLHGTDPLDTARLLLNKAFATPTVAEPSGQPLPPLVEPHVVVARPTTTTTTAAPVTAPTPSPTHPVRAAAGARPRSLTSSGTGPWASSWTWVAVAAFIAVLIAAVLVLRRPRSPNAHRPAHRRSTRERSP